MGVLVKICGVTDPDDARVAASAGARWIGLNFHPPSPRHVAERRAIEIVRVLPNDVEPVGVFVDRDPADLADLCHRVGLTLVQMHGQETPADARRVREAGLRVIRAFRLGEESDVAEASAWLNEAKRLGAEPEAVLIDAKVVGQAGGTGAAIPEAIVDAFLAVVDVPLILAGGLNAANVADRIRRTRPWMVDVASGVESSPGRKDPTKVAAFLDEVRRSSR